MKKNKRKRRTNLIRNCAFMKHCNEYRKKKYNDKSGICEQLKRRRRTKYIHLNNPYKLREYL